MERVLGGNSEGFRGALVVDTGGGNGKDNATSENVE
jgi:hypothetical protein